MRPLNIKFSLLVLAASFCLRFHRPRQSICPNGLMYTVPAPKGVPALDGSDTGWDLSAAEPVWMSTQLAKQFAWGRAELRRR